MTSDRIAFALAPDLLPILGWFVPGPRSAISPLAPEGTEPPTDAQQAKLRKAGALDDTGTLSKRVLPSLEILAQAPSYTRLRLLMGPRVIDQTRYSIPGSQGAVTLAAANEALILRDATPPDAVIAQLRRWTGQSDLYNCKFETLLPPNEALALSAVFDLHRRALLRAMLGMAGEQPFVFDANAVREAVSRPTRSLLWLVNALSFLTGEARTLSESDVAASLSGLSQAEHLVPDGTKYRLADDLVYLATRLLILDKIITFEAGVAVGDGHVASTRFLCVQSGVNALLYVEEGEEVRLASLSALALLSAVRYGLENPMARRVEELSSIIRERSEARRAPRAACAQCGAALGVDQRFCGQCGAAVEGPAVQAPKVQFCTNCGQPLEAGSKFCMECGAKVE
jgi:hypothetical protein